MKAPVNRLLLDILSIYLFNLLPLFSHSFIIKLISFITMIFCDTHHNQ